MTEPEIYIQRYLAGELTEAERFEFETELAQNPELREAVRSANSKIEAETEQALENAESDSILTETESVEPPEGIETAQPLTQTETPRPAPKIHPTEETRLPKSNFNKYAMIFFGTILASSLIYNQFFRPKGNFERAFSMPESIFEDLEKRYATDPDTVVALPESCLEMVRTADQHYQKNELDEAQDLLLTMALDTSAGCRSDAYFYLALIQLKKESPDVAVQCLTKIEEYSRFGDDIQWYMALAFVQMAEKNADREENAIRAMERVIESSQPEDRKETARKILEKYK